MTERTVAIKITSDGKAFVVDQAANAAAVAKLGDASGQASKQLQQLSQAGDQLDKTTQKLTAGQIAHIEKVQRLAETAGMTAAELRRFEAAELGVSDALSGALTKIEAAEQATHKLSLANSGVTRELAVMGGEALRGNWTRLEGSMTVLANRTGLMQSAITGLMTPWGLFLAGLATAAVATAGLAVQHEHLQQVLGQLSVQFQEAGGSVNFTHQQIREMIDTVASMPGVTSEAAAKVVGAFAHIRDQSAETIQQAILDTNDLAAALGVKAPEAAKELAHALNDPAASVKQLDSALNFLTASQVVQIEQMDKLGDRAGAASLLFAALHDHVKGAADQALTPFQQSMKELTVEWDKFNHTAESTNGVSQWQTLITGVIKDVTWLIANLPRADAAVAHMASRQAQGMHYGLPKDAGDTSPGGVNDFTPLIPPTAAAATGPGSVTDIDLQTKAIIERNHAVESAAQKEAEYQAQLNSIDVLIQENTRLHGANSDAVKRLESMYQGLIEQHNKHIPKLKQLNDAYGALATTTAKFNEQTVLQIDTGEKLSAGQKFRIDQSAVINKALEDGRISLVQWTVAMGDVDQAARNRDGWDALSQYITEATKENEALAAAGRKQVDQLDAQIKKQSEANEQIGLTKAQIDALKAAREEQAAQADEEYAQVLRNAAAYAGLSHDAYMEYANDLDLLAKKRRELSSLDTVGGIAQAAADGAKKAEEAWTHSDKTIEEGLYSAITNGGGSAAKKLIKDLENWFAHLVLQPIIGPIGQFGASLLNPGAASALGGVGNLFSTASGASSLYNSSAFGGIGTAFAQGYSGSAAIGTGSSFASTVGGGLATDAMGAGVAEGAAAAGIETGISAGVTAGLAAVPVVGWIALAGAALYSVFGGKGGGPKTEGGYAPNGLNIAGVDIGGNQQGSQRGDVAGAQSISQAISTGLTGLGNEFGITLAKDIGVFFAKDPQGDSMTQLNVVSDNYSRSATEGGIENVGRSDAEFQAALTKATAQLDLTELAKAMSGKIGDYLKALDPKALTADQITADIQLAANARTLFTAYSQLGPAFASYADQTVEGMGKVIAGMGGMTTAATNLSTYYDNFYSDEEKRQNTAKQIATTVTNAGYTVSADTVMNATREDFRALVEHFAQLGDAGAPVVAALMAVNQQFANITLTTEQAAGTIDSMMKGLVDQTHSLQVDLLRAAGDNTGADALQRQIDTKTMTAVELAQYNYNQELRAQTKLLTDATAVAQQRQGLESQVFTLTKNTVALRQRELAALDPANRSLQKYIYLLQDQATAQDAADQAHSKLDSAASKVLSIYQSQMSALDSQASTLQRTVDETKKFTNTLLDFRNSLMFNDTLSPLTPKEKYEQSRQELSSAAASGDAEALKTAAQDFLQSSRVYNASNSQYTSDFNLVQQYLSQAGVQAQAASDQTAADAQQQLDAINASKDLLQQQLDATGLSVDKTDELSAAIAGYMDAVGTAQAADAALAAAKADTAIAQAQNSAALQLAATQSVADNTAAILAAIQAGSTLGGSPSNINNAGQTTYGAGNFTQSDIVTFINANLTNPQAIYDAAKANGISLASVDALMGWQARTAEDWAVAHNLPVFADGASFRNGVVSRPTLFNVGLMGERTEEAILPLANVGGQLGVRAVSGGGDAMLSEMRALRASNDDMRAELRMLREQNNQGHADNVKATAQTGNAIAHAASRGAFVSANARGAMVTP